jgi:hypothetical protein
MATLETRRRLKVGHSIVVCLPPGWLSWKGLKQGDKVLIRTNRKLTIEAEPALKVTSEVGDTKN